MRNISSKTDNVGDVLPASDFNVNHRIELQGVVLSAGFSLDPEGGPDTDTEMLGKSLTVYANASQYYADTGAADAYEIDRVGNLQPLEQLLDGTIVYFKAANANTGASTIDVDGIGAKDLVDNTGAALTGNEIVANQYVTARYNSATDDFEMLSNSSQSLSTWINLGDDLYPVVSGTGTLGTTTNLVEALYLGDSNKIYLGSDQDFEIYHDGSNGIITNSIGNIGISNTSANGILFSTNNIDRWAFTSSGDLIPLTANTYDIGSTTYLVDNIYQGDNSIHYIGSDQDMTIFHSGTYGFVENGTGILYVGTTSLNSLMLKSNDINRWELTSSGHLVPQNANTYQIGSSTYEVESIYQGTNANHYFGNGQESSIYYASAGTTFHFTSSGSISLESGSTIYFTTGGTTRWAVNSSGNLLPIQTSTDLGSGTNPVDVIYYNTLTLISDKRLKYDFEDTIGLDFLLDLNPLSFKREIGDSTRRNHGLIAQEVESTLSKYGFGSKYFAGLRYDENEDIYGLDYIQFIAPIIKAIQELNDKIERLNGTL